MKTVIYVLFAFAAVAMAFTGQDDKKGLARVSKMLGKEVYVMCEPLADYEIVYTLNVEPQFLFSGRSSVGDQVTRVIESAEKEIKKGKMKEYDAILLDAEKASYIKFKIVKL